MEFEVWLSLVERCVRDAEVAGSNPVTSTSRSKVRFAPTYFFAKISHPPASLLLLFREKSRSARLLVCKRTRDGSQSLPTFHDIAPSAQPKSPAATVFAGKSRTPIPRRNDYAHFDFLSKIGYFCRHSFSFYNAEDWHRFVGPLL